MAGRVGITLQAGLNISQSTISIQEQVKKIQEAIKPLNINIDESALIQAFDKVSSSIAVAVDGTTKLKSNIISLNTEEGQSVRIAQTYNEQLKTMMVSGIQIIDNTKLQTEAEAKKTAQLERQIALYQEQRAIQLQNLQSQYGKLYNNPTIQSQVSEVQQSMLNLNPENFREQANQINTDISRINANLREARSSANNFVNTLIHDAKAMAVWTVVGTAIFGTIHGIEAGYESIKEFDSGLAGMKQTLEETYAEMGKVLNPEEMQKIGQGFLEVAERWGASVNDVLNAGKAWSRQYKDINEVMNLVNNSVLLSVVDNVSLENSVKSLEATMNQWNMTARNAAEANEYSLSIVNKWSALAHKQMATANDLADANAKMGSVARQTGIDFDHAQGLIVASLRATGRAGNEVGNMWKSVLGSIHSDKAITELKKLGVEVKDTAGNFRPLQDVLTDTMIKMDGTAKNVEEVDKAVAGGKFQWAKLAASLGDMQTYLTATAVSINSSGKAAEYMQAQMDTISRKTDQFHQALNSLVNSSSVTGLTGFIKNWIDGLRYFVDGLNNGGMKAIAFGGATMIAIGAIQKIETAIKAANEAGKAWNITTAISETLMGNWAAIAGTAVVASIIGITIAMGKEADKEKELLQIQQNKVEQQKAMINQYQEEIDFVNELEKTRAKIIDQMKNLADSDQQKIQLNKDLAATETSLQDAVGKSTAETVKNANYSHDAFQLLTKSLQEKQNAERVAWQNSQKLVQDATNNLKQNILVQMEQVEKAVQAYGILGKLQENGLWLEKSAIYARFQLNPTPDNAKAYDDMQKQISDFYENQKSNKMADLIGQLNQLNASSPAPSDISNIGNLSGFKSEPLDDSSKTKSNASTLRQQVDIEKSLIASYNTQVEMTQQQEKLLDKQLQTAKSAKDFNSELDLTSKKIANETLQLQQMGDVKSKIEQEFANVSSQSGFANTSQFVDEQGNATLYYQELFNSSSVETQKNLTTLFDKLSTLQKAWYDNNNAIDTLNSSLDGLKTSLGQLNIDKVTQSLSNLDNALSQSKSNLDLLNPNSEQYINEQQNQINILKEKQKIIDSTIAKEKELLSGNTLTPGARSIITDDLSKQELASLQNQKEIGNYSITTITTLYDTTQKQNSLLQKNLDLQLQLTDAVSPKNYDQINVLLGSQISLQQQNVTQIQDAITALRVQQSTLDQSDSNWQKINDQVNTYQESLEQAYSTLSQIYKTQEQNQMNQQLSSIEQSIFGGQTEQQASQALQNQKDYNNEYMTGAEKAAAVLGVLNQVQQYNAQLNNGIVNSQHQQITLTQTQLDLLNSSSDIKRNDLDVLQKQLAIQMTQVELSKEQNNKSVRIVTQNPDGSYSWNWETNQTNVLNLQGQLYKEQQDLAKTQLDDQNQDDQQLLNQKSAYFNNLKTVVQNALNGEYTTTQQFQNAISDANTSFLNGMQGTNLSVWTNITSVVNGNTNSMLANYTNYVTQMRILQAQLAAIMGGAAVMPSMPSSTQQTTNTGQTIKLSNGNTVIYNNGPNGWTEYDSSGNAIKWGTSPTYANGTEDSPEGFAITSEKGAELTYLNKGSAVIPANFTKNIMAFGANPINYMQNLIGNLNLPKMPSIVSNMVNKTNEVASRGITIQNLNVNANNANELVSSLQNYVRLTNTQPF